MYDNHLTSQLQTRTAILESQLDARDVTIAKLKADVERLTNLIGTLINEDKNEDKWDGSDVEPTLDYKFLDPDEKESR
jgi:hypothetical protein|tara:strand:+ start:18 stop:251 length:234 start_codon:yes stop_codon:yes gene_type:complete